MYSTEAAEFGKGFVCAIALLLKDGRGAKLILTFEAPIEIDRYNALDAREGKEPNLRAHVLISGIRQCVLGARPTTSIHSNFCTLSNAKPRNAQI